MTRDFDALHSFIDARQAAPHAWGRLANDCVGYALGAVEAQTGVIVAPDVQWSTREEALRTIGTFGSLEQAFDGHFERVATALAQRGDIAGVCDDEFGIHPMIVEGGTLVGPGERGNRRLPRSAMIIAWSADKAKR